MECFLFLFLSTAKRGNNVFGSVHPSVRSSVKALMPEQQRGSHQSKEFVCVSNSHADAVDRLLILKKVRLILMSNKRVLKQTYRCYQVHFLPSENKQDIQKIPPDT